MNAMSAAQLPPGFAEPGSALLEIEKVTKSFEGIRVLNNVCLHVRAGEVHALMGENGAGKSTLMKIAAGIHRPDRGQVRINGKMVIPGSPHAALKAGLAMIHQELLPFPDLSIAENIHMGFEPQSRFPGWIDKRKMRSATVSVLSSLGVTAQPECRMRELRVAEMQAVEIAKALVHKARFIIMDEPTSALSHREAEALFRTIGRLRAQGVGIVYISHKLEEVFRLANRVSVLRDGAMLGTYGVGELTREILISLMVGRSIGASALPTESDRPQGEVALACHGLGKRGSFADINFEVRDGEILGIAGLMGSGRTELLHSIFGLSPADTGSVVVAGKAVRIRSAPAAIRAGIGLVTEDRRAFGIFPNLGLRENIALLALDRCCRSGFVSRAEEKRIAESQVRTFGIKCSGLAQRANRLSGGNQQKLVIARTLLAEPQVVLLDEPTRGIDVAAKAEVHALIRSLARSGKAIVIVSSELPELLGLSHRILVMRQGRIVGELNSGTTTPEEVLNHAMPR